MKISLTIEDRVVLNGLFRNLCMTKSNKNETTYNEVTDQPRNQPSQFILRLKIKRNGWLLRTRVCKQPITAPYFEPETVLGLYNLEARS